MKIELTKRELVKIMVTCTLKKFELLEEYNNENTSQDRKEVLIANMISWKNLHDKIKEQMKDEYLIIK